MPEKELLEQIAAQLTQAEHVLNGAARMISDYAHAKRAAGQLSPARTMEGVLRAVDLVANEQGVLRMSKLAILKC